MSSKLSRFLYGGVASLSIAFASVSARAEEAPKIVDNTVETAPDAFATATAALQNFNQHIDAATIKTNPAEALESARLQLDVAEKTSLAHLQDGKITLAAYKNLVTDAGAKIKLAEHPESRDAAPAAAKDTQPLKQRQADAADAAHLLGAQYNMKTIFDYTTPSFDRINAGAAQTLETLARDIRTDVAALKDPGRKAEGAKTLAELKGGLSDVHFTVAAIAVSYLKNQDLGYEGRTLDDLCGTMTKDELAGRTRMLAQVVTDNMKHTKTGYITFGLGDPDTSENGGSQAQAEASAKRGFTKMVDKLVNDIGAREVCGPRPATGGPCPG